MTAANGVASEQDRGNAHDWHALAGEQVLAILASDEHSGLSSAEAQRRLAQHGPNTLPAAPHNPAWRRFLLQFHNPLIYVLLVAGVMTLLLQDYVDAGVIFGVVLINAVIGFIQEGKAERALDAVRTLLAQQATVLRDGERRQIDAALLVPGDLVLLESGDRVPADLRLLRVKTLSIGEAALTGESLPVEKHLHAVPANAALGDRSCLAYSGTIVAFGQGLGVVVGSGAATEIGRIGAMVSEVQTLATPLTRRLDQFARAITFWILAVSVLTFVYGYIWRQMPLLDIFLAVVGLAVAAIPEGLPAVVTIVLAIGTRVMARKRAIIRRLSAVETLGSVTVICSDKTGTLTRNEMTAVRLLLPGEDILVSGVGYAPEGGLRRAGQVLDPLEHAGIAALARCALLCNDAQLQHEAGLGWQLQGDPTEGALLTLARKAGLEPALLQARYPRSDAIPFAAQQRYMATLHRDHEQACSLLLLKGAPEAVLALCVQELDGRALDHAAWQLRVEGAAAAGERVLALAHCTLPADRVVLAQDDIRPQFTLLGLVGMIDPPREEAIAAVAECQRAGIRVKMITGDHAVTAAAIGIRLGLHAGPTLSGEMIAAMDEPALQRAAAATDVIARASPEHKLRLIAALQAQGELVAMTGDGVNDAPALKAADIGVAMGHKGTDAAREASDLVLTDDNFATIARAVREGRVVYDNIKKSLLFILPTNVGEAGVILLAVLAGLALPVTAGQILWINMITAVTLAMALAFEPAEHGIMMHRPRPPSQPLITPALALRIVYVSLLMIVVSFGIFEWELARGSSLNTARTAAVNMLVIGELVYLFNVRHFTRSAFTAETLLGNPVALWVSGILVVFQLLFTYAPPLQALFLTEALDWASWGMILLLGLLKFLAVEVEKAVWRYLRVHSM
ncbi:cation-transporting P-type ATPase [Chitinilyticum litopenaei]|uniref:cation-transporting P-type ATPase n=1 Tax=Chitinilyticum litopenaei TaxID=1121276 RepID=UPI000687A4D5|nr:cation-transporting P-type ATPase [Chitinilyticum litopenaei]